MSRAYTAAIAVFKKHLFTFDFGADFHITIGDIASLDRPAIKEAISAKADILTVGPIQFDLQNCVATFKGCRLGSTAWVATNYADTLIISNLPAVRDEIVYLVKSLIHLLSA